MTTVNNNKELVNVLVRDHNYTCAEALAVSTFIEENYYNREINVDEIINTISTYTDYTLPKSELLNSMCRVCNIGKITVVEYV